MKCPSLAMLSLYQDGALDAARTAGVSEHLMGCLSCQERLKTLGNAGLFFRIELASKRNGDCLTDEELGAYVSGRMRLEDRRRIEGHLVVCTRCLHEVAVMSDPEMLTRDSGSPVPTADAMKRLKKMAPPARTPVRPVFATIRWTMRAAAALLLVAFTAGQAGWLSFLKTIPNPVTPAAVATTVMTLAEAVSIDGAAGSIQLTSNDAVLCPDGSALAEFAREAGDLLREMELIGHQTRPERFALVQQDILNSGIIENVARLKELAGDRRDRKFLTDCEYLLMQVVKADRGDLDGELARLLAEIRRLKLIETARLIEIERGWSPCLASRT